jgi:DNA-binding CsgD family transcriptional regulator
VHSGITIPIHDPGREVDLISLSVRGDDRPPPDRLVHAYMLSVQYWLKYCELADRREFKAAVLTPQEVVCLRWCKEGKTNWEIGEILSISEKTAEFYLGNAMRKLGATNRITAVMVAIRRGIIDPRHLAPTMRPPRRFARRTLSRSGKRGGSIPSRTSSPRS